MTTDIFRFYLQNRLIQTSQTGGQWYSDTSPFSSPWFVPSIHVRPSLYVTFYDCYYLWHACCLTSSKPYWTMTAPNLGSGKSGPEDHLSVAGSKISTDTIGFLSDSALDPKPPATITFDRKLPLPELTSSEFRSCAQAWPAVNVIKLFTDVSYEYS